MARPVIIELPPPDRRGGTTLNEALAARRSRRAYRRGCVLSLAELGQLMWSAQGITSPDRMRAAPSAGALFPIEVYAFVSRVNDLPAGTYHYRCAGHQLQQEASGDRAGELWRAALQQDSVRDAAVNIVVGGVHQRTARKYGQRAARYVQIEVGHVGQNLLLTAAAIGLSAVPIGAFDEVAVQRMIGGESEPIYIVPVGR